MRPPMQYRGRLGRFRWWLFQQRIGWELYSPDLNGFMRDPLQMYRVKPIGWRRLLGRIDASKVR